jgi:adenylate cyclase
LNVAAVLLLLHTVQPGAIAEARDLFFDVFQRLAPRPHQEVPVKVVDIDDESLARLGQWPWPRTDIARLASTLGKAGAVSIAFDMVFSEPDRTSPARIAAVLRKDPNAKSNYDNIASLPDHDVLLGQTFARVPTVAGFFLTHERQRERPVQRAGFAYSGTLEKEVVPAFEGAIVPLPTIAAGAVGSGFETINPDRDGIIRSVPLLARIGDNVYPSLSLEALRVAQGVSTIIVKTTTGSGELGGGQGIVQIEVGSFVVDTTRSGELWMYYRRSRPSESIPAWQILTGAIPDAKLRALFSGQIVFVGTSAVGLKDIRATPISYDEPGASVHAQAVEQMILGRFLTRPDWADGLESFLLVLFGVGLSFALPGLGALRGGILALIALVGSAAGSWFAFRSGGLMLDPTYPAIEVALVYVACTLYAFYREERARAYIHRAFDRYLSPELVQRIASDPGQLELGGEERDMTVMFCDIRGFSRISERLTPPQVIAFLIDFLTPTSEVLLEHKATIDKFIGDAILAFWNAPLDDPDHVRNAALASLGLAQKIRELNAAHHGVPGTNWPGEVRIGVGIDSGPCCVGNIGSAQRLNYSLIGDTVNLASRIEGMTKVYGVTIAMGQGTASRLEGFAEIEIDRVRVVGRDTPERLHALLGGAEVAAAEDFRDLRSRQEEFLRAYRAQQWDEADEIISAMSPLAMKFELEKLLQVYRNRVKAFRETPPPAGWDGVFEAASK